jgi:hypothetical protein
MRRIISPSDRLAAARAQAGSSGGLVQKDGIASARSDYPAPDVDGREKTMAMTIFRK